jgi:hypothetical protein
VYESQQQSRDVDRYFFNELVGEDRALRSDVGIDPDPGRRAAVD